MLKKSENTASRLTAGYLPPISLDTHSETPIYRQIALWFQRAISTGHLQPGQRIPSTRALARELRVSRPSVLNAYEVLLLDGYLQSFVGAGTRVAQAPPRRTISGCLAGRTEEQLFNDDVRRGT